MNDELKPCPFCGEEVDFWTRQAHEAEEYQALIIDCKDCPANMEEWVYKYDKNFAENFEKKKAEMFEAWNRRAERKKGKWVNTGCKKIYKCSECGNYLDLSGVNAGRGDANFCPNCGAEMKDEE